MKRYAVRTGVMTVLLILGLNGLYADAWATKTGMPTARDALAIGVVNNKIYAIGGSGSSSYLSTNEEYDPATNTWATKASMPTARYAPAIGVVNGKIYAIGGYNGSALDTNEVYDPAADAWATKTSMPTTRGWLAIGVVNNKIYAIGGYNGSVLDTNEVYDPAADTAGGTPWATKTGMPTARDNLAIGVVNNKIYAIGGSGSSSYLSTNEEYDPAADTAGGTPWATKISMPTARLYLAIGVVNNKIYAIGGYNSSSGYLSTNEEYDPAADTAGGTPWATKTGMPTAREWLAIGVVNYKIYAIGGYNGGYLSTNEEYDTRPVITLPNGGETWNVGAMSTIICTDEPVDYYLSIDGGHNWTLIVKNANDNFTLRVAHTPTRYALIKAVYTGDDPFDPVYYDVSDSFFTITSTITKVYFTANSKEDGIQLEWQTDPSVPDIKGYNLYVSENLEGSFEKINESLITETTYLDKKRDGVSVTYRLGAVNGWGTEYIVGETSTISLQKPLLVYPNPIKDKGWISVWVPELYPSGTPIKVDVSVYNVQGQKIETIADNSFKPGFYRFSFNGKLLPNGEYFVVVKTPKYTEKMKFIILK